MNLLASDQQFEEALRGCEAEPIQFPGRIQPHGILLGIHPTRFEVTHASANAVGRFLVRGLDLIGADLASVLGEVVASRIRDPGQDRGPPAAISILANVEFPATAWMMEATLHRQGDTLILELEESEPVEATSILHLADWIHRIPQGPEDSDSIVPVCESIARKVRRLSGYDRVMIYRFHPDDHGEVIAESVSPGVESFLGLHYPASDIPKQARDLYLKNRVGFSSMLRPRQCPSWESEVSPHRTARHDVLPAQRLLPDSS